MCVCVHARALHVRVFDACGTAHLLAQLWPYLPSELVASALELAIAARVLDMRASPYDLSAFEGQPGGFDLRPVRVETPAGRRLYQREQAALAQASRPVRRRLLDAYEACIRVWDAQEREAEDTVERACG